MMGQASQMMYFAVLPKLSKITLTCQIFPRSSTGTPCSLHMLRTTSALGCSLAHSMFNSVSHAFVDMKN